ncbi:unnamed protein product [Ambrosiozyma monospora]|uniref:Unnamed protein product n=1 Tax=Ambrosiozyma monospora TaxID=43982 RepID=A0A9W6YWI8_AMBMO|nr:unnamed protein product [Ambrosiozyma monospora]
MSDTEETPPPPSTKDAVSPASGSSLSSQVKNASKSPTPSPFLSTFDIPIPDLPAPSPAILKDSMDKPKGQPVSNVLMFGRSSKSKIDPVASSDDDAGFVINKPPIRVASPMPKPISKKKNKKKNKKKKNKKAGNSISTTEGEDNTVSPIVDNVVKSEESDDKKSEAHKDDVKDPITSVSESVCKNEEPDRKNGADNIVSTSAIKKNIVLDDVTSSHFGVLAPSPIEKVFTLDAEEITTPLEKTASTKLNSPLFEEKIDETNEVKLSEVEKDDSSELKVIESEKNDGVEVKESEKGDLKTAVAITQEKKEEIPSVAEESKPSQLDDKLSDKKDESVVPLLSTTAVTTTTITEA